MEEKKKPEPKPYGIGEFERIESLNRAAKAAEEKANMFEGTSSSTTQRFHTVTPPANIPVASASQPATASSVFVEMLVDAPAAHERPPSQRDLAAIMPERLQKRFSELTGGHELVATPPTGQLPVTDTERRQTEAETLANVLGPDDISITGMMKACGAELYDAENPSLTNDIIPLPNPATEIEQGADQILDPPAAPLPRDAPPRGDAPPQPSKKHVPGPSPAMTLVAQPTSFPVLTPSAPKSDPNRSRPLLYTIGWFILVVAAVPLGMAIYFDWENILAWLRSFL